MDIPSDVLELKRAYLAADARCQKLSAALPSSVAVLAGEADIDGEAHAALLEARSDRLEALERLNAHPWWSTVEQRYDAWMRLNRAAQEG